MVGTGTNFIDGSWLEIEKDTSWDKLASTSLRKEGVVTVVIGVVKIVVSRCLWFLAVWLNTVLEAEKLPASVTDLDTGLSEMN